MLQFMPEAKTWRYRGQTIDREQDRFPESFRAD
jgi:hypothetical protein